MYFSFLYIELQDIIVNRTREKDVLLVLLTLGHTTKVSVKRTYYFSVETSRKNETSVRKAEISVINVQKPVKIRRGNRGIDMSILSYSLDTKYESLIAGNQI